MQHECLRNRATRIVTEDFSITLSERLRTSCPSKHALHLYWLGQAGFLLETDRNRILIDPYLSDALAQKYQGSTYDHVRMMPAPIAPQDLTRLDLVLCTHRHGDHMDIPTLQSLATRFADVRFVVPAFSQAYALEKGLLLEHLLLAHAKQSFSPLPHLSIYPLPAAHESFTVNKEGEHQWLGYVIDMGGFRIYHSGDCVPYAGLAEDLQSLHIDLALLPVNGRDAARTDAGILGNFTLDEAVDLCQHAGIPAMLAHHYGLFAFNTIAKETIDGKAKALTNLQLLRAQMGLCFCLNRASAHV